MPTLGVRPSKLHGSQIAFVMAGMCHDFDGLALVMLHIAHPSQSIAALLDDGLTYFLQYLLLAGRMHQRAIYLAQRGQSTVGMFQCDIRLLLVFEHTQQCPA